MDVQETTVQGKRCSEQKTFPTLELSSESGLCAEVVQRLIPRVPRTPIDMLGEVDHDYCCKRLETIGLFENEVEREGDCQFRSLSDQFYGSPEYHEYVREQAVKQLRSDRRIYEGFHFDPTSTVPLTYDQYLERKSRLHEWGDENTLRAASDAFGVKISVITCHRDHCHFQVTPKVERSTRVICLSYCESQEHYNSLRHDERDIEQPEVHEKEYEQPEVHAPIVAALLKLKSCCGLFEALFGSNSK